MSLISLNKNPAEQRALEDFFFFFNFRIEISETLDGNIKDIGQHIKNIPLPQQLEIRIVKGGGSWVFHQYSFPIISYKIIELILQCDR